MSRAGDPTLNSREARFLIFDPIPASFQQRILECITMLPFVEIIFPFPVPTRKI